MPVEIKVPSVGESVTEGILSRWLKKDGDAVRADEPVVELETDKATQEIVAPAAGRLQIGAPEGTTVQVGAVIGRVEEGAAAPAPDRSRHQSASRPRIGGRDARAGPVARRPASRPKPAASTRAQLTGSGRGGRITKQDVLEHPHRRQRPECGLASRERERPVILHASESAGRSRSRLAGAAPSETRQRMSAIRQRIAARLVEVAAGHRVADHLQRSRPVRRHGAAVALQGQVQGEARRRPRLHVVLRQGGRRGARRPIRSSTPGSTAATSSTRTSTTSASPSAPRKGLMVPIVRDCRPQRLRARSRARSPALAGKARDGKIGVSDLQGGTFTITNGGVFGSLLSTPILNPPQTAILGMHAIQKRPVAVNDQVVIRPMMYLALTYDHRLIDGREAVLFLVRIKECVENPERLMLEI